jgi:low temperature requirement protein LtrA
MSAPSLVSPDEQRVTFVELFFDLVFVFAVTQVVQVFHHHPGWGGVGQAVLVFWLIWWAWTQFTWALNAADTTHPLVELGTLAATAIAFFMAASLPGAFQDRALWFAIPYVAVRGLGLLLYGEVAYAADPRQHAAVKTFTLASLAGLAAVLAGAATGGTWQYLCWAAAILLDVVAALIGGSQEGWNLHPEHFVERHALFVIIALGESLIVAAGGVSAGDWTLRLLWVAVLGVVVTCGLWWTYFSRCRARLEHALASRSGAAQSRLARDAFSLIHFPMLCGIIGWAAVVEEAMAHPAAPLGLPWRAALAGGLALFLGSMVLALRRAEGRWLRGRAIVTAASAALLVASPGPPALSLGLALVGVAAIAALEQRLADAPGHAAGPAVPAKPAIAE